MTEMNLIPLGEQEYNELLRQAVAEIENARLTLSRQVSSTISGMHWNLSKLLLDKKIESKHGSGAMNGTRTKNLQLE